MLARLYPQVEAAGGAVQVLTLADEGEMSIGAKRQSLLEQSNPGTRFLSFIDDDDLVPADHVRRILEVLNTADPPDVVGFRLRYWEDGALAGLAVHSYDAAARMPKDAHRGLHLQERQPNHLNPVRRELALRVGYKALNFGEDADYAARLAILKPREMFVDWYGYEYLYRRPDARPDEVTNEKRTGRG